MPTLQTTTASIDAIQKDIIKEFAPFHGHYELMLDHIIDIGAKMPKLDTAHKIPANLLPGCLSKVWLIHKEKAGHLFLAADSNTTITKGLVSLLIRIFSGQKAQAILQAKLFFMQEIGLHAMIGMQRRNGVQLIWDQIKARARKKIGCRKESPGPLHSSQ